MINHYSKEEIKAAKKIIDFQMDEISAFHYSLVYLKPKNVWACQIFRIGDPNFQKLTPFTAYLKCLNWPRVEKAARNILAGNPYFHYLRWDDFDMIDFSEADKFTFQTKGVAEIIANGLNSTNKGRRGNYIKVKVVKKPFEEWMREW